MYALGPFGFRLPVVPSSAPPPPPPPPFLFVLGPMGLLLSSSIPCPPRILPASSNPPRGGFQACRSRAFLPVDLLPAHRCRRPKILWSESFPQLEQQRKLGGCISCRVWMVRECGRRRRIEDGQIPSLSSLFSRSLFSLKVLLSGCDFQGWIGERNWKEDHPTAGRLPTCLSRGIAGCLCWHLINWRRWCYRVIGHHSASAKIASRGLSGREFNRIPPLGFFSFLAGWRCWRWDMLYLQLVLALSCGAVPMLRTNTPETVASCLGTLQVEIRCLESFVLVGSRAVYSRSWWVGLFAFDCIEYIGQRV